MKTINRKVVSMILLAALDFPTNRKSAAKLLQQASQEPDFEDTIEGVHSLAEDSDVDPFDEEVTADDDGDDGDDGDDDDEDDATGELQGMGDLLEQPQVASVARAAARRRAEKAALARSGKARHRAIAAEDDEDSADGKNPIGQDFIEDDEEEARVQKARLSQVRANLKALAKVQ